MEVLPLLQGLSTPILLAIGAVAWRAKDALHKIDLRLSIVESELKMHRLTERDNGNS